METGLIMRGAAASAGAALPGWKAWDEGNFQVSDDGKLRVESAEQWIPFLLAPAPSLVQEPASHGRHGRGLADSILSSS